jgi:predicted  nucleic acid-binding Zn-ribbon protein
MSKGKATERSPEMYETTINNAKLADMVNDFKKRIERQRDNIDKASGQLVDMLTNETMNDNRPEVKAAFIRDVNERIRHYNDEIKKLQTMIDALEDADYYLAED